MTRIAWLAGALALAAPAAASAQVVWEPSVSVDYSRGSYGAVEETEVWYAPVGLRITTPRWRFDVAAPYLNVRGPQGSVVGGIVIPGSGPVVRNDGFGDVTVQATYSLFEPRPGATVWELSAGAKLPTGVEELSTGKADYNVSLGVRHPLSDKLQLVGSLGYQWLGDPAAYELTDGGTAALGLNYTARPRTNVGFTANYRAPYLAGFDEQVTLSPYVRFDTEQGWALTAYVTKGFTDSSPDYGVGLQLGRVF